MAAFAGVGCACKEASTAFTNASKYTLNLKGATKDTTPFGATGAWAINTATIKSWSGTVSAFFDNSDTAQVNMVGLLGSTVSMEFDVNGTPNKFTGTVIITELDPVADAQDVVKCDYKFVGTGACSYA